MDKKKFLKKNWYVWFFVAGAALMFLVLGLASQDIVLPNIMGPALGLAFLLLIIGVIVASIKSRGWV